MTFTKTSWQFGCCHTFFGLPPYEALLEVASGVPWRGLSRDPHMDGNDQCPAAPEDMVQPGLYLAKGQVQDPSGGT